MQAQRSTTVATAITEYDIKAYLSNKLRQNCHAASHAHIAAATCKDSFSQACMSAVFSAMKLRQQRGNETVSAEKQCD